MNESNLSMSPKALIAAVFVILVTTIALRIVFSTGYYVTADDYYYSKAAHEISEGQFNIPDNHWNARVGHTISIAVTYLLFGVDQFTATFSTILYSILNLLIIFLLSRELFPAQDYRLIAIVAAVFYTFLPISIAEGSSLSMHQGAVFYMFLAFYFMLVGERTGKAILYILGGITVGISYLFHETGAYIFIPIALYYLVKRKLSWKPGLILSGFILVVFIETALYYASTDTMLYRQTISINPLEVRNETRITGEMSFMDKLDSLKTIDNPLNGTFIGDSWFLEPFRWSFLDPSNSILYHILLVVCAMLLMRRDRNLNLLLIMFLGLYLYFAYGSPNPYSYEPLRRLPRYTLPCAVFASIIAGYGLYKLSRRPAILYSTLAIYIVISIFSISIKGGEIGQKFHQAINFYQFMSAHPNNRYYTDISTYNGIEFLSAYTVQPDLSGVKPEDFSGLLDSPNPGSGNIYFMINVPENYPEGLSFLKNERLQLVQKFDRKPRKICLIEPVQKMLSNSLCNLTRGGRIYRVRNI